MGSRTQHSTMIAVADRLSEMLAEVAGPLDTACWIWQGRTTDGYGYMRFNGPKWRTNRLTWFLHFGPIPEDKWVLHHCDTRSCCNPAHLYLGTAQDNTNDMLNRGRDNYARVGEEHGRAIIRESDILVIRELCDDGANHSELARKYGVKPSAIDKIAARRTWRHIP